MKYQKYETYEEAVQRKEELLEKINAYNIALLEEKELPYTDEEIEEMMEEYQILNDSLRLTEEEKKYKYSSEDLEVSEDGSVEVKQTFFDKVSIWTYIYSFFGVFLSLGLLNSLLGTEIYELIMNTIYSIMFKTENHLLMENIGSFGYGCIYYGSYLIYPIILIVATLICYLIVKKKGKPENKKFLFWVLMVQIILSVIVSIIIIVGLAKDFTSTFNDTVGYGYPIWLMEKIYPDDPDKVVEILKLLGLQ